MIDLQRFIFESTPHPVLAALLSGFATVDWFGQLCLTSAGEAYLASLGK